MVDFPTRTWEITGLQFKPGEAANKARKTPIDLAVVHWTGGENPPPVVYNTLRSRGLGIEFVIDVDGVVWQMADPLLVNTADAGAFNERSLGFEIVSAGVLKDGKVSRGRVVRKETVHESKLNCLDFLPAQVTALGKALKALHATKLFLFELTAPVDEKMEPHPTELPGRYIRLYRGVVGHLHLASTKTDPGLQVFRDLMDQKVLAPSLVEEKKSAALSPPSKSQVAKAPRRQS